MKNVKKDQTCTVIKLFNQINFYFLKRGVAYFLAKSSCSTGGEGGTLESKCELKKKMLSNEKWKYKHRTIIINLYSI